MKNRKILNEFIAFMSFSSTGWAAGFGISTLFKEGKFLVAGMACSP